jgi:hypothetical protein
VARTPISAGLARFDRPKLAGGRYTQHNLALAWSSFRKVKWAIRLLVELGEPRTPKSLSAATERLFPGKCVPEKTITENPRCRCIYDAFATTTPHPGRRARPPARMPGWLRRMPAAECRLLVLDLRDRLSASEEGRKAAIGLVRDDLLRRSLGAARDRMMAEAIDRANAIEAEGSVAV